MKDINKSKHWKSFDWDEYEKELSVPIKKQWVVDRDRKNRLRWETATPEERAKHSDAIKKKYTDPKFRDKRKIAVSIAQKKRYAKLSSDERKRLTMHLIEASKRTAEQRSKAMKNKWKNDEQFKSKMQEVYNKRGNGEWKNNVKIAITRRQNNKEWLKNTKEAASQPVLTPNGIFKSIDDAVESHKMSRPWLYQRFEYNKKSFYRITKDEFSKLSTNKKMLSKKIKQAVQNYNKKVHKKQVQTPYGIFPSISSAGTHTIKLGIAKSKTFARNRVNDPADKDWYIIS